MIFERRGLVRFLVFLLLVAVSVGYVALKQGTLKRNLTPDRDQKVSGVALGSKDTTGTTATTGTGGPQTPATQDFFVDYRLDRDRVRSQQIEQLRELVNNPKADDQTRREAGQRWLQLTDEMGREVELEGLIRSKGFEDAVVLVRDGAAVVIVKAKELTQVEVARIADMTAKVAGVKPENINIVPKPK
ncbi:MAG: SpoIIIAH-like family protein [Bacillota bacterium]